MPRKDRVISLFDATTLALDPWLARGYSCWAYDLLHCGHQVRGRLHCVEADLDCASRRCLSSSLSTVGAWRL